MLSLLFHANTANRGLLELRQEICKFHKEHYNQIYDPENEVIVTIGGSEAIDLAMRALLNPGDEVIVLDPNYELNFHLQILCNLYHPENSKTYPL